MRYLLIALFLVSCGKDPVVPPKPPENTTFVVQGQFIEVIGTVKTVSAAEAKAAIATAVRSLEQ